MKYLQIILTFQRIILLYNFHIISHRGKARTFCMIKSCGMPENRLIKCVDFLFIVLPCSRRHRTSRSPLSRGFIRGANGFVVRTRVGCPRLDKYDNPVRSDNVNGKWC